ncbi:MAG: glycosyl hydrolase family 28-related protein, partial [Candidatus Hydrogenedentales bacterium]
MRLPAYAILCFVCVVALAQTSPPAASPYAVRAFGAVGDGVAKDTAAVQKAMDACAEGGGGTVYFAPGAYLCGSLHLRSNVTLYLDTAAVIKGSRDIADYDPYEELGFENDSDRETSFFHQSLIWGEGVEHIGIVGAGTIDSNFEHRGGPKAVGLKRCKYVEIRGIHVLNTPNYAISMLGTDYVNIEGVTIQNGFADGIDPDSCQNVRISNCHIETFDDAIVPKASFSLGERRASENITVTNCYLATVCNAFKLGTESGGDFKRIAVSNCVMSGLPSRRPALSGISLESVDGSNIDGVAISNCTMI